MDTKVEILLNSYQNVDSVNVDTYEKVELSNNTNKIMEYDIRNVLSATEVFDAERKANPVYRIYGKMEYMSMLNGLRNNYIYLEDFFNPQYSGDSKNILNSFNFYLVKPAVSGYTHMTSGGSTLLWLRYFQVVATPDQFELYPVGYSNNVFGEQEYAFNFNIDVDVTSLQDNFGFPLTELFLYAEYIKNPAKETLNAIRWSASGSKTITPVDTIQLNVGDYVMINSNYKTADIIEYAKTQFLQVEHTPQTFYIKTNYIKLTTIYINILGNLVPLQIPSPSHLQWKYNPLIPLRLRYFSGSLYKANSGSTIYDQVNSIPYYATKIDNNGNFVWREILSQGFTDPITGLGVDYPFVNKRRYLFSSIVFDVVPDLNDSVTLAAFADVWFTRNQETIDTTSTGDINNIGKPCQ